MDGVSRDEFVMLRDQVADNMRRLEVIDQVGTRGIGAIGAQLAEVIKDVATVQKELSGFRGEHERLHEREALARAAARRWAVTSGLAALLAVEAPLGWLIAHLH